MAPDTAMEAIELRAEQALAGVHDWIWDGETLPVPIEDIADSCFGLLVRDVADLTSAPGAPPVGPDGLSGLLLAGPGEIWVNAEEGRQWPPRRRFTIAHELGHWELHRGDNAPTVFCRSTSVAEGDTRSDAPARPPAEDEANMFAAALCMPGELVRRHYAETGGDFDELCRRFRSSRAAMGRRLHQAVPRA